MFAEVRSVSSRLMPRGVPSPREGRTSSPVSRFDALERRETWATREERESVRETRVKGGTIVNTEDRMKETRQDLLQAYFARTSSD